MKQSKKNGERIVKAKPSGYEERRVRRLGQVRLLVGVLLLAVIAGSAWFTWERIMVPYEGKGESGSSQSEGKESSQGEILPVYGDDFNLKLVNKENPMEEGEEPQLTEYAGVQMDERIVPALEAMLEAAENEGVPLTVTGGYVSAEEQDTLFQQEVEKLKKENKYSQVMAEQTAEKTVSRGGCDDAQTGMTVQVAAKDEAGNFENTAQYRWLSRHCIEYGFVIRYPEGKNSYTGKEFDPTRVRYVGTRAAGRMRQLQMCLEEYAEYSNR